VHFKFVNNEKAISIFSYKSTWTKFIKEYKKFAYTFNDKNLIDKYLLRLKNKYCLAKYETNVIISQLSTFQKNESRYRAINLNSYNIHQTLEIRILPYFQSFEEAKKAILWLIKTIDKIYNTQKSILFREEININTNNNNSNVFIDLIVKKKR